MSRWCLLVLSLFAVGCSVPVEEEEVSTTTSILNQYTPRCGVVAEGRLRSTVSVEEGIEARVTGVLAGNALVVLLPEGETTLVKLQGLANPAADSAPQAINTLSSLTGGTLTLFRAGANCAIPAPGGGQGIVGQLLTSDGMSLSEAMMRSGLVDSTVAEPCAGAEYSNCLAELRVREQVVAGELSMFLWKPESDSDGHLAIHSGPFGADVIVNGERGQNQGPGNGYGSLARFSKSGCGYPAPRIQVIDSYSGLPYTVKGATTFTVPNPCGRHCLRGGSIVGCSK